MTKQEILEAINSTIVPNDSKGITAESLANILTEIVNAAGEGGGGVGGEYLDMTMIDANESDELTPEAKAHNAEVYAKLVQALRNNAGTPYISVPTGDGYNMSINSVMLEELESTTNIVMTLNMTIDGQFTNVMFSVNDVISGGEAAIAIGSNVVLTVLLLKEDGQVMITVPGFMI